MPSNNSEEKKKQREYRQETGKNNYAGKKRKYKTKKNKSKKKLRKNVSNDITRIVTDQDNNGNVIASDTGALGDELNDLIEYALDRDIIDASDTIIIPVVEKTISWIQDIKKGRTRTGALVKEVKKLKSAITKNTEHKNSNNCVADCVT